MAAINFEQILTKSSFARGKQCHKLLWYHRKEPLANNPTDNINRSFIKIDNSLLDLAFSLYPNGSHCSQYAMDDDKDWEASVTMTREAIANGAKTLYNPTFCNDQLLVDIHLMHRENDAWTGIIVKSATRVSDRNLANATYQYHALKACGFPLKKLLVLTINNSYVRQEDIDLKKLFVRNNITQRVLEQEVDLASELEEQVKTLQLKKAPNRNIGPHCTEPYVCAYQHKCWSKVPNNSVFELVGFSKDGMFDLWNRGFKTIDQIPDYQDLSFNQSIQRAGTRHINRKGIQSFLNKVSYPLLLIDFEGFVPAIPAFENSKPFEIIPFLFAGIYLESESAEPEIRNHIASAQGDPRRKFAEAFSTLQQEVNCILVYDPHTEKTIINHLAQLFPDLSDSLKASRTKIKDLSNPILRKDFYLPQMKGYHSMKYVLPAVAPELVYDDLAIKNGRMAATTYQMLREEKNEAIIDETLKQLLEYCSRDTLGLLKVYQALLDAVK